MLTFIRVLVRSLRWYQTVVFYCSTKATPYNFIISPPNLTTLRLLHLIKLFSPNCVH